MFDCHPLHGTEWASDRGGGPESLSQPTVALSRISGVDGGVRQGGCVRADGRARNTVALGLALLAAGPSPGRAQSCAQTEGHAVVQLINEARAAHGLAPLDVDTRLVEAAQVHAHDLAAHGHVAHEGSDGSEPAVRATRAGYAWTFIAENVAAGYASPPEVVERWLRSPSHRENMLSDRARHVGIGYARRQGTRFDHFWAASFGMTGDERRPPANDCHP